MKAFCYVTPSHKGLLTEFLIPSLPKDLQLTVYHAGQRCPSGRYMSKGWNDCMLDKVEWMTDIMKENSHEKLLFLDADIQFFGDDSIGILDLILKHQDLVTQDDSQEDQVRKVYCAGFIAINSTDEVINLFRFVRQTMLAHPYMDDQCALNSALRNTKLKTHLLDRNLFWCPRKYWDKDCKLKLSKSAIMHHANWCMGVENKRAQLIEGKRIHDHS